MINLALGLFAEFIPSPPKTPLISYSTNQKRMAAHPPPALGRVGALLIANPQKQRQ
jgi:hypothetical protein